MYRKQIVKSSVGDPLTGIRILIRGRDTYAFKVEGITGVIEYEIAEAYSSLFWGGKFIRGLPLWSEFPGVPSYHQILPFNSHILFSNDEQIRRHEPLVAAITASVTFELLLTLHVPKYIGWRPDIFWRDDRGVFVFDSLATKAASKLSFETYRSSSQHVWVDDVNRKPKKIGIWHEAKAFAALIEVSVLREGSLRPPTKDSAH